MPPKSESCAGSACSAFGLRTKRPMTVSQIDRVRLCQAAESGKAGKTGGKSGITIKNYRGLALRAAALRMAKNAAEDGVDLRHVEIQIETGFQLGFAQVLVYIRVGLEQREKIAAADPDFHGIALDQAIGILARDAFLRQRQQHPLRMDEAA